MVILTLNCGSSSAKFQVYDWEQKEVLGVGLIERIGQRMSNIEFTALGKAEWVADKACPTHKEAVEWVLETLVDPSHGCINDLDRVKAVGHRVVHGGEAFKQSTIVTDQVLKQLEGVSHLAPLHNPANILGIRGAMAVLPNVSHCAIMDTAWHQTMEAKSFMYPLPYEWYTKYNVRRYGFHGTSYLYTAKRAAVLLGKDSNRVNLIIAHIGNGASICAIKDGRAYDTSMGMTPLEGLMMGTRCGDIDPAIVTHMMKTLGVSPEEMDSIMNKKSGVLGISETVIDRRDIYEGVKKGDERSILTMEMETYRIRKYIGSYMAALGRVDAVVFTAGVGEMNPLYREKAVGGLENMGILLDPERNNSSVSRNCETCVSHPDSSTRIFVIPTDEELVMTEDTFALMDGSYDVHTSYRYHFQDKGYKNKARERNLPGDLAKNSALKGVIAQPQYKTLKGKLFS